MIRNKTNDKTSKIVSVFLSCVIIALLIVSGPASALSLGIGDLSNSNPEKGETLSFEFGIDVLTSERVDISEIKLVVNGLNGQGNLTCVFDVYGNEISGCGDIKIELLGGNATFGYGYGYNYGYGYGISGENERYNATIDTTIAKDVSILPYPA